MIDFNKFSNFLTDKNIYSENVGLYEKLVNKITNETASEWMITKFANGIDIGDGNPIYSAYIENKKIAIRIIQTKIDINASIFSTWINKNPFEMTDVKELVISLQLRQDTYEDLSYLIEIFVNKTLSNNIIEFLNGKYHKLWNENASEALQM
jgi:hypothetical protein